MLVQIKYDGDFMFDINNILFSLTVMCTYFIEGIVGFGSTILAIPIVTIFTPFRVSVPVMTNMGVAAPAFMVIRDHRYICRREFIKIFRVMILGLPIGMLSFSLLPERLLKVLLGILMAAVAIKNIYTHFSANSSSEPHISTRRKYLYYIMVFFGGIVQGAFSCGGPFVVIYASKFILDKTEFRATLQALWLSMNIMVLIKNIALGFINTQVITITVMSIPLIYLSLFLSNMVHKKIGGRQFSLFVNLVLLLSGVLMAR